MRALLRLAVLACASLAALLTTGCFTSTAYREARGLGDEALAPGDLAFEVEEAVLIGEGFLWIRGSDTAGGRRRPWHVSVSLDSAAAGARQPNTNLSGGGWIDSQVSGDSVKVAIPFTAWQRPHDAPRGVEIEPAREGGASTCSFAGFFSAAGRPFPVERLASGRLEDLPPWNDGSTRLFLLGPSVGLKGDDIASAPPQLVLDTHLSGRRWLFLIAFLENPAPPRPNPRVWPLVPLGVGLDVAVPIFVAVFTTPMLPLIFYGTQERIALAYGRAEGCRCVQRPLLYPYSYDLLSGGAGCYEAGLPLGTTARRTCKGPVPRC